MIVVQRGQGNQRLQLAERRQPAAHIFPGVHLPTLEQPQQVEIPQGDDLYREEEQPVADAGKRHQALQPPHLWPCPQGMGDRSRVAPCMLGIYRQFSLQPAQFRCGKGLGCQEVKDLGVGGKDVLLRFHLSYRLAGTAPRSQRKGNADGQRGAQCQVKRPVLLPPEPRCDAQSNVEQRQKARRPEQQRLRQQPGGALRPGRKAFVVALRRAHLPPTRANLFAKVNLRAPTHGRPPAAWWPSAAVPAGAASCRRLPGRQAWRAY